MLCGMVDSLPPSEFGGKQQLNRVQPFPHEPTASEKLMLQYTTADDTGLTNPDTGEAFHGLLSLAEQTELMESSGQLEKGQYDPRNQGI